MSSINRVTLLGHVGSAEVRYAPSGLCVLNISLATQEKIKDKETNTDKYVPEWHKIVVFGKQAENLSSIDKGLKLFVQGSLKTTKFQDKQTGQDRYSTQIVASHVEIISKIDAKPSIKEPIKDDRFSGDDGDIPF